MLLLECVLETFQRCFSSSPEKKLSSKLYLTVTPLAIKLKTVFHNNIIL